jgi:hypothetical protein
VYVVHDQGPSGSCSIIPVTQPTVFCELEKATERLAKFVQRHPRVQTDFTEMAADFLKGEDGRWYFLQV